MVSTVVNFLIDTNTRSRNFANMNVYGAAGTCGTLDERAGALSKRCQVKYFKEE